MFLGFGFLPKNMERLRLDAHCDDQTTYAGTAFEMTHSEVASAKQLFPKHASGTDRSIGLQEKFDALSYVRNNLTLFSPFTPMVPMAAPRTAAPTDRA